MAKNSIVSILLSTALICCYFFNQATSQEVAIGDGVIPNRNPGPKKVIPIYISGDDLYTFVLDDNWYSSPGNEYFREDWFPFWQPGQELDSLLAHSVEYYHGSSGFSYVYDAAGEELHYRGQYGNFHSVDCLGRPVADSEFNIHIIRDGPGDSLVYIYSSDTLNTNDVNQTFMPPADFIYLVSSPDNSVIGALFFDDNLDSLYKFIAFSGETLEMSAPTEVISCDENILYARDIVLNDNCEVLFIATFPDPYSWGIHTIWTEEWGARNLRESWDDVTQGTSYQISLGIEQNEILAIHGENYVGNMAEFFYSSDGGNIWYRSSFDPGNTYYGSGPRTFSDTLHFIYYFGQNNDYTTFHYPISLEQILDEMTEVVHSRTEGPESFSLSNYPNPFNSSTTISFSLPEAGQVRLHIYDIAGRLVKTLMNDEVDAGAHSIIWDGRNNAGQPVSSGVYFYKLSSEGYSDTRRMLLLK